MNRERSTTFYIMRHGESKGNALGKSRYGAEEGSTDWGLTETGQEQVRNIGKHLEHVPFTQIFSSTMLRARETAGIIALGRDLTVKTLNNIHERSLREYVNDKDLTPDDVKRQMQDALMELDEKGKMDYKHSPDMESAQEGSDRLATALNGIGKGHQGEQLLVVTHGNLIRSFLTGIGFAKYDELPGDAIDNTGYAVLQHDGRSFAVQQTYGVHKNPNGRRIF